MGTKIFIGNQLKASDVLDAKQSPIGFCGNHVSVPAGIRAAEAFPTCG
jgi:hypothetical protein